MDDKSSIPWLGHIVTYGLAVGTTFIVGRLKDIVADVSSALDYVDEATSRAERQLRLHSMKQNDTAALAEVFTSRSHLGVLLTRQFGTRHKAINDSWHLFSDNLDRCDLGSVSGLQPGECPLSDISNLRLNQQALRAAISGTPKGQLAKFIGRRSVDK